MLGKSSTTDLHPPSPSLCTLILGWRLYREARKRGSSLAGTFPVFIGLSHKCMIYFEGSIPSISHPTHAHHTLLFSVFFHVQPAYCRKSNSKLLFFFPSKFTLLGEGKQLLNEILQGQAKGEKPKCI